MGQYATNDVVLASYRGRDITARILGENEGTYSAVVLGGGYDGDRISLVDALVYGHKVPVEDKGPAKMELEVHVGKTAETDTPISNFETKDEFPPPTKRPEDDDSA